MTILLFLFYTILSLLWSDNIYEGLIYIIKYWYFLPAIVIFKYLKKENMDYVIGAFLLGMFISEILSYGIFFELWTFKHGTPTDPTPIMNHLQYSIFLAFTSLLLLNRIFFEEHMRWKLFYILYFLIVTANLFINGGRTGYLAFILSIFVVGFLNIKNKYKAFFSILLFIVAVLYTAYHFSPIFKERFTAATNELSIIQNDDNLNENKYCGSFGLRLGSWIVGLDISKDNLFFGTGVSDEMPVLKSYLEYEKHQDKYCKDNVIVKTNFHNDYMQILVQIGIIGLFLYLLIWYSILKIDIKNKKYKNLAVIFVSVYCISSMVENMFHQQFSMALFALFVGIFLAQNRIENES
jgi:O-antigen ligase